MNFKFSVVIFILLSLACSTQILHAKLVERSSKKIPNWIGITTEDKNKLYFSGSSTQDTFEKAKKIAVSDALTQIAESLDLTMSVNTSRIINNTEVYLQDQTSSKTTDVRILDTRIKDIYFEKYENEAKQSYNVHVRMEYSKKDYQKEKERLAKEYEGFKQNVINRSVKANTLIQSGNYQDALAELFEALKTIYTYGVLRSRESEILSNINKILASVDFQDSFVWSQNQSGITANIDVSFSNTKEKCKKFAFVLNTLNNFSIDTVYTNDSGIIEYQFKKVSFLKKSNYKLDFDIRKTYAMDNDFFKSYAFKEISHELNFLGNKRRVFLNLSADKSTHADISNLIKSSLVQNGFTTSDKDSNFILNVTVVSGQTVQNTIRDPLSADTQLYISNADVTAELLSSEDKTQINRISFEERGFGKTKEKSHSDLLQKIASSITNTL